MYDNKKIDPRKNIMEEINIILKNYIVSLMKPLENENFFNNKEILIKKFIHGFLHLLGFDHKKNKDFKITRINTPHASTPTELRIRGPGDPRASPVKTSKRADPNLAS